MRNSNQWMPIESAPLDGTDVLVMCDDWPGTKSGRAEECDGTNTAVAAWWEGEDNWIVYCDMVRDPVLAFEPTHWMPLPEPPIRFETSGEEEKNADISKPSRWNLKRRDAAKYDYFGNPRWEFTAHEITDERGNIIVSDEFGTTLEFEEGDWDLVAAAPQMLEFLKSFVKIDHAIERDLLVYGNSYVPEKWLELRTIANAIIAKVEGGQE